MKYQYRIVEAKQGDKYSYLPQKKRNDIIGFFQGWLTMSFFVGLEREPFWFTSFEAAKKCIKEYIEKNDQPLKKVIKYHNL